MSAGQNRALVKCSELCQLSDQIGEFIEYWGFKRVHGRIWAHLYLSKVPLDAFDIRNRLNISKALVSLSVRDLIHYAVIKEVGKSEQGTILYEANPDIREAIFNVLKTRETKMMARIQEAHHLLTQVSGERRCEVKISEERLQNLREIIDGTAAALTTLLAANEFGNDSVAQFFGVPKVCSQALSSESSAASH